MIFQNDSANLVPKMISVIAFLSFLFYILFSWYVKPYHLLVSLPFDVLAGISYGPPLTDPFLFI